MKKTGNITLGAMLGALSVAVMLVSYFPYLTYSVPAIAGLFIMTAVIEMGTKWALFSYITAAVLTLLLAEPEASLFFVFFFGYYPIVKVPFEKVKKPVLRFVAKFAVFNVAVLLIYFVLMRIMGIDGVFGGYTKYMIYGLWIAANGVFVLYDYMLAVLAQWYLCRIHPVVVKLFKR